MRGRKSTDEVSWVRTTQALGVRSYLLGQRDPSVLRARIEAQRLSNTLFRLRIVPSIELRHPQQEVIGRPLWVPLCKF
jgi:DNA-binding NarL/FixJ family response regulator